MTISDKDSFEIKKSTHYTDLQITFLHAVCCKILGHTEKAESLYKKLAVDLKHAENKKQI